MLVDGRLSAVGSLNLDERSLYLDTETMLVIDSVPLNEQLTGIVEAYKASSLVVGVDNQYVENAEVEPGQVSWFKKLLFGLAALITVPFGYLI